MGDLAGGLGGLIGGGGSSLGDISGLGASGLGNADPFSSLFGSSGGGGAGYGSADLSGGDMWGGIFGGGTTSSDAASYALNQPGQDMWNQNQPGAVTGTPAQDQSAVQAAQQQVSQSAQAAMQQPAPSLSEAYGETGPFTTGGSPSAGAGSQGPQGWQVAGPPTTAGAPPLGTQTPPGGYVPPEQSSVTSRGGPFTPGNTSSPASPDEWNAAKQQMRSMVGAPPAGQVPMPQPRPAEAPAAASDPIYDQNTVNPMDPVDPQSRVPMPQPRPAGANAPATPPAPPATAATPPATADPAASVPNQPGSTASSPSSVPQADAGGAPQNPIQAIMQALGIRNMPPQLQQLISQFLRQLQGVGMGPMPYGGGQGMAVNPMTGMPPINPRTGRPYPLGTQWDQIPWSRGWDPSKQQQGVPWQRWQNIDAQGQPMARSPSESGAPTGGQTERMPQKGSRGAMPPPRVLVPSGKGKTKAVDPDKVAQLSPDQVPPSMGPRMTPKEQQQEEEDLKRDPRTMSPEQMKKLRDLLKKRQDEGKRMIGRAGKGKTDIRRTVPGQPPYPRPRHDYTEPDMSIVGRNAPSWTGDTNANQPVINRPPPLPWGSNQPSYYPSMGVEGMPPYGRMVPPNMPYAGEDATYMNYPDQFRGM